MQAKDTVLWSLINSDRHPAATDEDMTISTLMPMVKTLFPGIDYYSTSGFHSVMRECCIPALRHQFPGLIDSPADKVDLEQEREVTEILPSDGYQWQDDPAWKEQLATQIKAA